MFKLLAVVALLVVGIGAVVYAVAGGTSAAQSAAQYLTAAASRATVTQSVVATGNLAAAEVYGLAFGAAPQVVTSSTSTGTGGGNVSWTVKSVSAKVGDHVAAGAVVAEADTASAEAGLATAKANLQAAKDKLATDKAGATETQRQQAAAAVTSARQQLDAAKQNYADTLKQNDLTLRQAQTAVDRRRDDAVRRRGCRRPDDPDHAGPAGRQAGEAAALDGDAERFGFEAPRRAVGHAGRAGRHVGEAQPGEPDGSRDRRPARIRQRPDHVRRTGGGDGAEHARRRAADGAGQRNGHRGQRAGGDIGAEWIRLRAHI